MTTTTITISGKPATLKVWRTLNCSGYKAEILCDGRILCHEIETQDTAIDAARIAKQRARRALPRQLAYMS